MRLPAEPLNSWQLKKILSNLFHAFTFQYYLPSLICSMLLLVYLFKKISSNIFVEEIIQITSKYMRLDPDLLCLKCLFERRFLHIGMWMWNPFREKKSKMFNTKRGY